MLILAVATMLLSATSSATPAPGPSIVITGRAIADKRAALTDASQHSPEARVEYMDLSDIAAPN